jgi:hypothetical protein
LRPLLAAAAALLVCAFDDGDDGNLEGDGGNLIGDSVDGDLAGDGEASDCVGDADADAVFVFDNVDASGGGSGFVVNGDNGDGDNGDDLEGENGDGRLRTLTTPSCGDGGDDGFGISMGGGGCEVVGSTPADGFFWIFVGGDMLFDAAVMLFDGT